MNKTFNGPRLSSEGIFFTVSVESGERICLISKNALNFLQRNQNRNNASDFMVTYFANWGIIHKVALRLVATGENATPLVLGAAYFLNVGTKSAA